MAAEKAFYNVLNYVSRSQLNFSIYQTPFSAQLFLKKSFAKHYEGNEHDLNKVNDENETFEGNAEQIHKLETDCKTLEDKLKLEKKKNKKERQKVGKKNIEEAEVNVKEELIDNEEDKVDVLNVSSLKLFRKTSKLPGI
jgi:hypothetical protein